LLGWIWLNLHFQNGLSPLCLEPERVCKFSINWYCWGERLLYLEMLNELGIVGFVFYIGLLTYSLKVIKAALSYQSDNVIPREFLVVIATGLMYELLLGTKGGSYGGCVMLYFFLGAGLSLTEVTKRQLVEWETYCYKNSGLEDKSSEESQI